MGRDTGEGEREGEEEDGLGDRGTQGTKGGGGSERQVNGGKKHKKGKRKGKTGGEATAGREVGVGLIERAREMLVTGHLETAYTAAKKAVRILSAKPEECAALSILAEIALELGEINEARTHFLRTTQLDPDGLLPDYLGGGADKFLYLAQICEEGGEESVRWFEKGAEVLRAQLASSSSVSSQIQKMGMEASAQDSTKVKSDKLAATLCAIIEVHMTDLSFLPTAEITCETLITEALLVSPSDPSTLQTLANIRISQGRKSEAISALERSLASWKDLDPEDANVPAFPTRISLARLLMEVEMLKEALVVLERLVREDDGSVEAWYLGGWCLFLLAGGASTGGEDHKGQGEGVVGEEADEEGEERQRARIASREWLRQSLKLFDAVEYEDERLAEHAKELVRELDGELGPDEPGEEDEDGDGDEQWESESGDDVEAGAEDGDQEMRDS